MQHFRAPLHNNSYKAIAKRVEPLTLSNRTMHVIQVSASPTPLPPKRSCFHFHLALKLKGINIEKGERGGRGVGTLNWKRGFRKKRWIFDSVSQPFCSFFFFAVAWSNYNVHLKPNLQERILNWLTVRMSFRSFLILPTSPDSAVASPWCGTTTVLSKWITKYQK